MTEKVNLRERFLKLSGYKESDILGENLAARRWSTSNGGKYQLSPSGNKIRRLMGPEVPRARKSADSEGGEEE